MRTPFLETCQTRYLLADGGIATTLRAMKQDANLVPELLNTTDPETVLAMHADFAEAGADCLTTNSFSANATRLTDIAPDECNRLCAEAARLAHQAAGPDRYVLGSIGPWHHTGTNWQQALADQTRALVGAGVDAILLETLGSVAAATECVAVTREHSSKIPVIASFSFKRAGADKFNLVADNTPLEQVALSLAMISADAYGANCGTDVSAYDFATIISALRAETDKCLLARPNAGSPSAAPGELPVYPESPELMAEAIWGIVRAGANIVGGCCGASPDYIRAFRSEMDMLG